MEGAWRALQNPRTRERTRPLQERGSQHCPPGAERSRPGVGRGGRCSKGYLLIYAAHGIFVATCGIFPAACEIFVAACKTFSCGMQGTLVVACELSVAACGIKFPDQGWNPGPLHWEHGALATGSPGKSW